MNCKGHIVAGVVLGEVVASCVSINNLGGYFLVVGVSSLLADIDHRNSLINRINPLSFITSSFKHRGFTHTILGMVSLGVPIMVLGYGSSYVLLGYGVGYMSHLIADSLTTMGVMWMYPMSRKYYRFPISFKTGGIGENICIGVMIVVGIVLLASML